MTFYEEAMASLKTQQEGIKEIGELARRIAAERDKYIEICERQNAKIIELLRENDELKKRLGKTL